MQMVYLVNFPSKNATKGQEFNGTPELEKELLERGIIGNGEITVEQDNSNNNDLLVTIENLKKDLEEKNKIIGDSTFDTKTSLVQEKMEQIEELEKQVNEKDAAVSALMVVIEELKSLVEEAIKSKQGQIPEGFVKYKES